MKYPSDEKAAAWNDQLMKRPVNKNIGWWNKQFVQQFCLKHYWLITYHLSKSSVVEIFNLEIIEIVGWWNDHLMKLIVDETANSLQTELRNQLPITYVTICQWNPNLMKWQVDETTSWWNLLLMKQLVNETASW